MNLSTNVVSALQLKRCEVPLELQANFAALRHVPLFFAGHVRKLNHRLTVQDRVLIATLDHVYVCDPNGDILRCFPYAFIETVVVDLERHQMALVVPREYDVAFSTPEVHKLLHVVEVLRGLHHCRTGCKVEYVASASSAAAAMAAGDPADGGTGPNDGSPGATTTTTAPDSNNDGHAGSSGAARSRWRRVVEFLGFGQRRKEEWFTGAPGSNCIGRGYFSVKLKQPPGFELCLDNRNSNN